MALVLDLGVQKDLNPEVVFAGPGLVSCLVGDGCGWISKARATEQLGPGGAETAVGIPVGVLKGGTWQHAEGVVEEKVPAQTYMPYPSNLPVNLTSAGKARRASGGRCGAFRYSRCRTTHHPGRSPMALVGLGKC